MNSPNELKEITRFLLEYANRLMGSGVHTSRVIRNTRRIGKSLDVDVKMSLFQKTMVVSVCDIDSTEVYNEVAIIPAFPISFELNAELSALSWEAYDNHLPLETLWDKYEKIISRPKMDPLCTLFLVGFANASFCALFGGDWTARLIVFSATLIGFYIKQIMQKKKINHYLDTANKTFKSFFVGQFTEAIILGSLCTIGMLILKLPYAAMTGTVVGVTALIPIVGAYIGAALGAFMILTQSPMQVLVFIIFLVILQQVEGNLIYPKVVGSSIGLPGIWVLAAVTVGGSLFGITGMLLGVPTIATVYKLVYEDIANREERMRPPSPPADDENVNEQNGSPQEQSVQSRS